MFIYTMNSKGDKTTLKIPVIKNIIQRNERIRKDRSQVYLSK